MCWPRPVEPVVNLMWMLENNEALTISGSGDITNFRRDSIVGAILSHNRIRWTESPAGERTYQRQAMYGLYRKDRG